MQYVHSKTHDPRGSHSTQFESFLIVNTKTGKKIWSARSSDLSPIEHLWDHIGLQVSERHDVNNIRDLERALQAEWVRIPLKALEN